MAESFDPATLPDAKAARYAALAEEIAAVLEGEANVVARQATVASMLADAFERYFWTGFYLVDPAKPDELVVGPYQGTLGCLRIAFRSAGDGGVDAGGCVRALLLDRVLPRGPGQAGRAGGRALPGHARVPSNRVRARGLRHGGGGAADGDRAGRRGVPRPHRLRLALAERDRRAGAGR